MEKEIALMNRVAVEAGRIARTFQEKGFEQKADKSKGDPFLTEADLAIDAYLKAEITKAFPNDAWLSEETVADDKRLTAHRCWIVDPIDGTKDFIDRTGSFAVSIGLAVEGRAVLGAVVAPMRDQYVLGVVGQGIWLNGQRHTLGPAKTLAESTCSISSRDEAKGLWEPYKKHFQVHIMGSIAYKMARAALGVEDLTISLTPKALWDVCAGDAILQAAGCRSTDRQGNPLHYDQPGLEVAGCIGCRAEVYAEVLALLGHKNAA